MGFLADFVRDKMQKEHESRMMQMDAWTKLAGDPNSDEPTKQWAYENLTGFPDVKKHLNKPETHQGIFDHLKGLIGLHGKTQDGNMDISLPDLMEQKSPEMLNPQQPATSPIHMLAPWEQAQRGAKASAITASQNDTNIRNARTSLYPVLQEEGKINTDIEMEKLDREFPQKLEQARQTAIQQGEIKTDQDNIDWGRKWVRVEDTAKKLAAQGMKSDQAMQYALESVFPAGTFTGGAGAAGGNSVDAMSMRSWLDKNPGKTADDYTAWKQQFPTQRLEISQAGQDRRFDTGQRQSLINSLRDDYTAKVTPYIQGNDAYRTIQELKPRLLSAGTNASMSGDDIMLVYSLIKIADPSPNAVREGEVQQAQQAMTVPADVWRRVQGLTGISSNIYSPAARKQLIDAAESAYRARIKPNIDQINSQFKQDTDRIEEPFDVIHPIQAGPIGQGAGGGGGGAQPGKFNYAYKGKVYPFDTQQQLDQFKARVGAGGAK